MWFPLRGQVMWLCGIHSSCPGDPLCPCLSPSLRGQLLSGWPGCVRISVLARPSAGGQHTVGCRTSVDKEAGSGSRFPAGLGLGRDVWVTAGSWPGGHALLKGARPRRICPGLALFPGEDRLLPERCGHRVSNAFHFKRAMRGMVFDKELL